MNENLLQIVLEHGYLIMFALMIVEGPIATIGSAFLASLGYFSLSAVFMVSLVGDIVGDLLFYSIGYFGGRPLLVRYGDKIGLGLERQGMIEGFFKKHGSKAIFLAKSTTGLCLVAFVFAGVSRMPLRTFLLFSFLGGIIWSGFLTAMGYFFGSFYVMLARYIEYAGGIVLVGVIVSFVVISAHKKRRAAVLTKL